MSKYVSVRAIPAEGYQYRWGAGRPFSAEAVTLEVVDGEIPQVQIPVEQRDVSAEVQARVENIRLRYEFLSRLPPTQIHASQLEELRQDRQLVVIDDVAAPPPPPKSEADVLRDRVAQLEKQAAKR